MGRLNFAGLVSLHGPLQIIRNPAASISDHQRFARKSGARTDSTNKVRQLVEPRSISTSPIIGRVKKWEKITPHTSTPSVRKRSPPF